MAVGIVRTHWSGTSGGPGLTQLAVKEGAGAFWTQTQAQNAVNAVRQFWESRGATSEWRTIFDGHYTKKK